jgi:hypothetical protein
MVFFPEREDFLLKRGKAGFGVNRCIHDEGSIAELGERW